MKGSRLTPQQVRFALLLAEAPSIAEAARQAGYAPRSRSPRELVRRPEIRTIAYARRRQIVEGLPITAEAVVGRLWELATKRRVDPRAAVQACSQLLKYLGGPVRVSRAAEQAAADELAESERPPIGHVDVAAFAAAAGVPLELNGDDAAAGAGGAVTH